MALDFPSSPALNQTYTYGGRTWTWNGTGWAATTTTYGPQGPAGTNGTNGTNGVGVPTGGTAGQILAKTSSTDYATAWINNSSETQLLTVKNSSGATMPAGSAVYVSGANGTNILISLGQANAESTSSKTLGLLTQSLANNATGTVTVFGLLGGLDTSAATIGDSVWLSPTTPGGLVFGLANKPSAPNHMVFIGNVTRVSATVGEIFVRAQNGFELEELHNVLITSPASGDVIQYNSTTGVWVNSPAPATGFDPFLLMGA